jgi:hypothetical protein
LFRLIWHSLSLFSCSVSLFFVILWYAHESWVFLRKSNYLFWNCGMIIIGIYWVIVGLMNLHWVLAINDSYFHYLPLFNLFLLSLSLKSFSLLVSKVVWPNRKAKDKMTKTWTEGWFLWQHVFNKYFLTFSILRCLSVWCSYLSISCNINSLVRKEVNNSKLFWIGINWRPYKQSIVYKILMTVCLWFGMEALSRYCTVSNIFMSWLWHNHSMNMQTYWCN